MRAIVVLTAVCSSLCLAADAEDLAARVSALGKVGGVGSPSFSADGQTIAVSTALTGTPQVWTVPARGGWPKQLTTFADPVAGPNWSPRGDLIAFSVLPGGGLNAQVYVMKPDGSGLRRLTAGGKENNFLFDWSHDGKWLGIGTSAEGSPTSDLYLVDPRSGERREILRVEGMAYLNDLSRDARRALVIRVVGRGDSNVSLVDLTTGKETLLTPHEGTATYGAKFAEDGRILLASDEGRDRIAMGELVLRKDGTPDRFRVLAERADADVEDFLVEPGGRRLAVLWDVAGRNELTWLDLRTGKQRPGAPLPAEIIGAADFSPDGRQLAMSALGPAMPMNMFVQEVATGVTRQVSNAPHPGVDLSTLVRPELVKFRAHDGEPLSGWLYVPRGFTRPGPVVLSFHGGPEGQEVPSFRADYQALLSAGIAVFAPNVRGSSGFGKRFVHLDDREKRVDGVRDIESCWKQVVEAGLADPKRVGVMGGSYGGYMTMAALTEFPDKFAAGANLFGVVNFETFFQHTEAWMASISGSEYGDPKTQVELLRRLSPIHKLDRVKGATLVMHGANDTNVPVVEAEQVVETLKKRGVPVEYLLFPDEGHGWRKLVNRERSTVTLVSFFSKYLGVTKAPTATLPAP